VSRPRPTPLAQAATAGCATGGTTAAPARLPLATVNKPVCPLGRFGPGGADLDAITREVVEVSGTKRRAPLTLPARRDLIPRPNPTQVQPSTSS
jgi:hypothetical protein